MQPCRARQLLEPAPTDCRQTGPGAGPGGQAVAKAAWVIIGRLVSLSGRRLVATLGALWVLAAGSFGVQAAAPPPSTWVALGALPHQGQTAVFALAVDPS